MEAPERQEGDQELSAYSGEKAQCQAGRIGREQV